MAKVFQLPNNADFYFDLAEKQKDNLEFYDAILNINEAIRLDEKEKYISLKAEIIALNDDEIQSNELYFYIQNKFKIDKSIAIASNFIRFNREDLIQYYFKRGIERVIESGGDNDEDSNQSMLKYLIKDIDKIRYVTEEELEELEQSPLPSPLPSYDKFEKIIDIEKGNFIDTKDRREAKAFAKMLTLLDLADYEGAIRESERIPSNSKYFQDALELKMNAMLCIEDFQGALNCAEKLGELAPCNVSMFTVYAYLYDDIYDKDIAKRITQKANKALDILLNNDEYDEIFDIAEIFFDNKAFSLCVKFLEEYNKINNVREESLLMYAISLVALNRREKGIKILNKIYDLYGINTYALTILELIESDFEIEDYSKIFNELPDKFVNFKINSLVNKFKSYSKGYCNIDKDDFVREAISIAKLTSTINIAPLIDELCKNIVNPIAKKILDLILISDLVVWEDNKAAIIESILNNANESLEVFEGALVINGLYNELRLPLTLDIEQEEYRKKYKEYYKMALTSIIEGSNSIDCQLVAQITLNIQKTAMKVGFNPQSPQCLTQIICIIYKMAIDGESFDQARYFTRNANFCSPKTLKRYRDIFDVDILVKSFIK